MGNAPLNSPPVPTEHRVVIPITTRRQIGTKLYVFPPMPHGGARPTRSTTTTTPAIIHPSPPINQHATDEDYTLPPQLESTSIIPSEYKDKLRQLQERLDEYKGGRAALAVGCFSLLIVVGFTAAYLTPGFWSSPLFHHPGYISAIAAGVLLIFTILIRYLRRETRRLLQDVEDLYRPWRARGIFVKIKHVASVGTVYYMTRNGRVNQGRASRSNCYCLVMTIANDEEQGGGDNISLGTVMTDDSE